MTDRRAFAAALAAPLLATALYLGGFTALWRAAARHEAEHVDFSANVDRDPCFWLNTYGNREGTAVRVEDDSSGAVLSATYPSDFYADSAMAAICATRREAAGWTLDNRGAR